MSGDAPGPTPEGQLIRQVRDLSIPRLSIRAAAKRIGLSAEQWGYVERGYRPAGAGQPPRPFSPPAATLAKMAHALRITPERLESEGQRPDAAKILREILHHEAEAADAARAAQTLTVTKSNTIESPPMTDAARIAAARPYADEIWQRVLDLTARGITSPTGEQVFPGKHEYADARTWDDPNLRRTFTMSQLVWLLADIRRAEAERSRRADTA
jgi:transcriptional regulator with XRE-family HTH domain